MSPLPARQQPAEVLLVEDNEDDVFLMREAFRRTGFRINLHRVENGEQCLAFLRKEGLYADAPTPHLVLLDLNLPIVDGRQVLAAVVADRRFRSLPVVILTTSANERDIEHMYGLRCSSYIVKPLDFDSFEAAIRVIGEYWFNLVTLPAEGISPDCPPGKG